MTDISVESIVLQTLHSPLQSTEAVLSHAAAVREIANWSSVAVLYDDQPTAVLILLIEQNSVVGVNRIALSPNDTVSALNAYQTTACSFLLGCCQGETFTRQKILDLSALTELWESSTSKEVSSSELAAFFKQIEDGTRTKGRGPEFNTATINQVLFDAHGRCMFDGCGVDLRFDPVTGTVGNFAYLAHNVASSESGPRGILYLSAELSNEPDNVLLLCDKHHRVVDKVAKLDYPASRLQDMRRRYCENSNSLLDLLQLKRIPAFFISWPIRQHTIAAPSPTQIAEALVPIDARQDGQLQRIVDNDESLRALDLNALWVRMPEAIEFAANKILSQSKIESFNAALFVMGLMPALIALGAKLGNKNSITPMLLHRESGLWYWPSQEPRINWYEVRGVEDLPRQCADVVLEIALTEHPDPFTVTSNSLNYPRITITAHDEYLGNGALGHPSDGRRFRQHIHELLHKLHNDHRVERVHILPCASNAACTFLGQAHDNYHPDLVLYDFHPDRDKSLMIKRLLIKTQNGQCVIKSFSETDA